MIFKTDGIEIHSTLKHLKFKKGKKKEKLSTTYLKTNITV